MFKALAELVMRGRTTAIAIALLCSWLSFISQAVLGLVTLRKGWQEGLLVTLWASLPAFVGLWIGQVSVTMALAAIAVFFVSYLASCVLRFSVSWPVTLMSLVATASLSTFIVIGQSVNFEQHVADFFTQMMTPPEGELSDDAKSLIDGWTAVSAGGLIAYWIGVASLIGVLLARWWQSLLYNPGGFQQEFHHLRLPATMALVSAGSWLYCSTLGDDYSFWAKLVSMPLWVSGLGLAHWLIARYKFGVPAVVSLYVLAPLLPAGVMILMLLALLDAGLDLRNKIKTDQSPKD